MASSSLLPIRTLPLHPAGKTSCAFVALPAKTHRLASSRPGSGSRRPHRSLGGNNAGPSLIQASPARCSIGRPRDNKDHGAAEAPDARRCLGERSDAIARTASFGELSNGLLENESRHQAVHEASSTSDGGKGSVPGAVALIIGTCVGAGMLALPSETAPAGFLPSASLLVGCWAFLTLEAFLIAEVNIGLMKKRQESKSTSAGASRSVTEDASATDTISLRTMAEETLGPIGGWVSSATYVFLSYTLVVAYVAKAADVLTIGTDVPFEVASGLFVLVLGGLVYAGNTQTTDWINRVMTGALLAFFGVIIFGGSLEADWSQLSVQDWSQAPGMLPILFLSLVFHDLIPVLCTYLDGDLKRVRTALALGGAGPLAMFLIWDAVALSLPTGVGSADPLQALMSLGGPSQSFVIESFSLLAVMTSFMGTVLSMSEFFIEQLGDLLPRLGGQATNASQPKCRMGTEPGDKGVTAVGGQAVGGAQAFSRQQLLRAAGFGAVLLPPWLLACIIPDAFYTASEAAGAYGMTVLYGVFPPLMFWNMIKGKKETPSGGVTCSASQQEDTTLWEKPAGGFALASMAACSLSVIVGQASLDLASLGTVAGVPSGALTADLAPGASVLVLAATPVSDGASRGAASALQTQMVTAPLLTIEDNAEAPSA